MSAEQRRAAVLDAAIAEFGAHGLAGTSTEEVARRAGISHPYLFRLFPTKKELFLALVEQCYQRIAAAFELAAEDLTGQRAMDAMAGAYEGLLEDRTLLLLQLQGYAASSDPEVRAAARAGFSDLWAMVERLTGLPYDKVVAFFAMGMLMNVAAALDLRSVDEHWADWCPD